MVDVKKEPIDIFLSEPEKYINQYLRGIELKWSDRSVYKDKQKIYHFNVTDAFLYYFGSTLAKPNVVTDLQLLYFEGSKYIHYAIMYKNCALIMLEKALIHHRFTKPNQNLLNVVSRYINNHYKDDTLVLKTVTHYHLLKDYDIREKLIGEIDLLSFWV
jgi:hypothetical protein